MLKRVELLLPTENACTALPKGNLVMIMRNTAIGMWCRAVGYNFTDVSTVLPDNHILADNILNGPTFFQSQIHYSITTLHLDFACQISKITTKIKGNDNFFLYSETPAASPLHGADNSTAAFLSLCLMFYSPSARSSLNKPAQSSCTQRSLPCGYHYDIRVKRMSRPVFLNRLATVRYIALASIIPGREKFSLNLSF